MKKLILGTLISFIFFASCEDPYKTWAPAKRPLSAPWNTYLVGETTTDISGSVYGSGTSTVVFDGTNVFSSSSYQHWQGGGKYSKSDLYITRIELNKQSWDTYPVWRIFYKMGSELWHSESDYNNALELDMRVPTILSGKYLKDYVEIPGP